MAADYGKEFFRVANGFKNEHMLGFSAYRRFGQLGLLCVQDLL
jgi:hypothetical protein